MVTVWCVDSRMCAQLVATCLGITSSPYLCPPLCAYSLSPFDYNHTWWPLVLVCVVCSSSSSTIMSAHFSPQSNWNMWKYNEINTQHIYKRKHTWLWRKAHKLCCPWVAHGTTTLPCLLRVQEPIPGPEFWSVQRHTNMGYSSWWTLQDMSQRITSHGWAGAKWFLSFLIKALIMPLLQRLRKGSSKMAYKEQ